MTRQDRSNYTKIEDKEDVEAHDIVVVPSSDPFKPKKQGLRSRLGSCPLFCYILLGIVLFIVFFLIIVLTGGYFWVSHQVKRFTVTERVSLPIHEMSRAELEIVKDRSKLFADYILAGQVPVQDLTITMDEMNGFIAQSDYMRGNAFMTISHGTVKAEFSLPARGLPGGKGRYFVANGFYFTEPSDGSIGKATVKFDTLSPVKDLSGPLLMAALDMYWDDSANPSYVHELVLNIHNGTVMGKEIPQEFIEEKQNLVEDLYDEDDDDDDDDDCIYDPAAILDGIESVSIQNNAITFHARRNGGTSNAVSNARTTTSDNSNGRTWLQRGQRKLQAVTKHGQRKLKVLSKFFF